MNHKELSRGTITVPETRVKVAVEAREVFSKSWEMTLKGFAENEEATRFSKNYVDSVTMVPTAPSYLIGWLTDTIPRKTMI
jgi:hypothetical protein